MCSVSAHARSQKKRKPQQNFREVVSGEPKYLGEAANNREKPLQIPPTYRSQKGESCSFSVPPVLFSSLALVCLVMSQRGKGLASSVSALPPVFGLFYLLLDAAKRSKGRLLVCRLWLCST